VATVRFDTQRAFRFFQTVGGLVSELRSDEPPPNAGVAAYPTKFLVAQTVDTAVLLVFYIVKPFLQIVQWHHAQEQHSSES
jgi:hypothetical protein